MEMINVQSSQIAQIGHDGQSTLRVLFRRGGLYDYQQVTSEEFEALHNAASIGSHFGSFIKGVKPFNKVEGSDFPKPEQSERPAARTFEPDDVPENENQEVEKVAQKTSLLVQNATSIKVTDETTQIHASDTLLAIAALAREVQETFKPMKDAAFKAHRTICEQEKKHLEPLQRAEISLKGEISKFITEQRRIAAEAEDEARRIAQEKADAEAKAEAERLAIEDAITLESQGDLAAAQAVLENPAPVTPNYIAPAPVAPAVAQVKGISTRTDWDCRIVDETLIPREFMMPNESAIRAVGKATCGKIRIDGVEFFEKIIVASRRG